MFLISVSRNSIQQGQFFLQQTFTHGSVLPTKDSELLEFLSGNPVIKLLEFKFSMNGTGCSLTRLVAAFRLDYALLMLKLGSLI